MKKKLIASLLAAFMAVSVFAGCSDDKKDSKKKDKDKKEETEETEETEESEGPSESETDETEPDTDGTSVKTKLFTIKYDDSVWTYNEEDDLYETDSNSKIAFSIPDPEDEEGGSLVRVYIDADIEEPYNFRDELYSLGFDEYEYAENDAYDKVNVGGVDFLYYENEWGSEIEYIARVEGAGETIIIDFYGEIDNYKKDIDALVDGITFNVTDTGNVDGPWYWNGEPIAKEDLSAAIGSFTVETHQLKMDTPNCTHETFDHYVQIAGDKLYILSEDNLKIYGYDGQALTFIEEIALDKTYTDLCKGADGKLYMSSFMNGVSVIEDGKITGELEGDIDHLATSPDGTWGISYFGSDDCYKVTFTDTEVVQGDALAFPEFTSLSSLYITENSIIVYGSDDTTDMIAVYDLNGSLKFKTDATTDSDSYGFGSVTYAAETANGYIVFDGNMREIFFFDLNGEMIGVLDDAAMFDTHYPWMASSCKDDEGNIVTVMTEERDDQSSDECIAFTVKGF